MNSTHKKRVSVILFLFVLLTPAIGLILYSFKQNINLFLTPTELLNTPTSKENTIRVGGYVKMHSVQFNSSGDEIYFIVTDRKNDIRVVFNGVLPNLFREGQVVIVTGKFDHNVLSANQVLAKHDEKYMPKPLISSLKTGQLV